MKWKRKGLHHVLSLRSLCLSEFKPLGAVLDTLC